MSGFVLAHSYNDKLRTGRMRFSGFLRARVIRLWPLYAFATMLGFAYFLAKVIIGTSDAPTLAGLAYYLVLNLSFLPAPIAAYPLSGMFPFAPASWSLFTEMVASIAFGALLFRLRTRHLALVAASFTGFFLATAYSIGDFDLGWGLPTLAPGILRTMSGFSIGMLLNRIHHRTDTPFREAAVPLLVLSTAAIASLLILPPHNLALAALSTIALYPMLIFVAARTPGPPAAGRICEALGRISYPLYLLHTPILLWISGAWKLAFNQDAAHSGFVAGAVMVGTSLALSYLATLIFDEPIRAWINRVVRARDLRRNNKQVASGSMV